MFSSLLHSHYKIHSYPVDFFFASENLTTSSFNSLSHSINELIPILRREAAPHATSPRPEALPNVPGVSISDEKPLHMRRYAVDTRDSTGRCFNLRREAAPHATTLDRSRAVLFLEFQSQTRSRSTCDFWAQPQGALLAGVSISDEKPLHMRQEHPDVSLAG